MPTKLSARIAIAAISLCSLAGVAPVRSEILEPLFANANLSLAQIETIEADLKMPMRAYPIAQYERFYAVVETGGIPVLTGVFVRAESRAGIRIVDNKRLPMIFDGGCMIINLRYDLAGKRLLSLACNGYA